MAQMGIYLPGPSGHGRGGKHPRHGHYRRLQRAICYFFFANGKCAKIPLSSYATKQNRRKLLKAYSDKEELSLMLYLPEETELAIRTSASRMLLVGTAQIPAKTTRDSQGVAVVTLKKNQRVVSGRPGGHAGAGEPSPLPRPQPARHGCSDPRRRRGRADEPAVKNSPSRLWRQIPPLSPAVTSPRRGGSRPLRMGPLAWWQSFWLNCKVSGFARGSLSEGAGTA